MFQQTRTKTITIVLLLAGMALYTGFAGFYGRELIIEAAYLVILAISLDLVAGYGGMISLCHGAIFGIGAYVFAVLTSMYDISPLIALPAAIVAGAIFGLFVGAVTSKTSGIFFIMTTLAFGQMVYVYVFENRALGGDDGLSGVERIDLSWLGLDMGNSMQFAWFSIVLAGLAYVVAAAVLRSGFGRTLVGIRSNEGRMRALGLPVRRYKAVAFAISGALAALAGTIAAQQTMFVSPQMMGWMMSGEALVIVILGGLGTLVGPAVGAVLFVFLQHEVSELTRYWHMIVGIVLILVVVLGNRGAYGQIEHMIMHRRRPVAPAKSSLEAASEQEESHA
ncbi:branched-chain amino acid ABC transporter permease [Pararhizobium haloflavum]|uniref:branched-chain amino acid ABC transporter permease n=1 Tax=Pararhizobium haloflavum TaxID=2037914 RepID=UPI000C178E5E|nr:branched-chain amino acid ABC transporter permease [Pararhizobium haloflavum]